MGIGEGREVEVEIEREERRRENGVSTCVLAGVRWRWGAEPFLALQEGMVNSRQRAALRLCSQRMSLTGHGPFPL